MNTYFRPALVIFILMTLLTGVVYPLLVTGCAQLIFPQQANGSLLKDNTGNIFGSKLIGQAFHNPAYFWGRPSATAPYPYNAVASSGSNLGPVNPLLINAVQNRIQKIQAKDFTDQQAVPIDLVTASASGLDPHISPAAAVYQIKRIALNRHISETLIKKLVDEYTEPRDLGFLGEPRVNVLLLNYALDVNNKTGS